MDRRLLKAAVAGDAAEMKQLALDDPGVLVGTTPQGNTCLHIASIHGHEGFCKDVLALDQSVFLLTTINNDGETPLLTAVTRGRDTLASVLLKCCCDLQLSEAILKQDKRGCNALHHATWNGYRGLALELIEAEPAFSTPLLTAINEDGETSLLTAVTRGHDTLASVLLKCCCDRQLSEAILKQDKRGCNALHHAISRGYGALALKLIEAEPALSKAANEQDESPMFIAAMRNFEDVIDKLLGIPDSAHSGALAFNALHAAVRNDNKAIVKRIMETRPEQAKQENEDKYTPMHLAVYEDKIDVITVLLEHDPFLGYLISTAGKPLLCTAASGGHVGVARELLKYCPDAPYCDEKGSTFLHEAVLSGQEEFVEFVLGSQQLQHLINMADNSGQTSLHLAQRNGLTRIADLLSDKEKIINNAPVADDASSDSSSEVETTGSRSSSEGMPMDAQVLEAAICGDARLMKDLASQDPSLLLGNTPQGNTCLHIASIHGNQGFCNDVLMLNQSLPLLNAINADGETPLLTAVARGRATLASALLRFCRDQQLSETILKQDNREFNALHHAILRGHRKLALELIQAEPALSKAVNKSYESPMFIAVMRGYGDVLEKLLEISDSAHGGAHRYNALHAAVRKGNAVMAKRVMEARPWLVRQESRDRRTPMHLGALENKTDVLTVLLEHDPSLGYLISGNGAPLLCIAASQGHVGVARELLRHCPDPPYCSATGSTCLHIAVSSGQEDFVRFVVCSQQLNHLVPLPNGRGETALQLANRIMAAGDERKRKTMMSVVSVLLLYDRNLIVHTEPFTSGMERLLEAAVSGHVAEMRHLHLRDPGVLLGTTPKGNTCLHIAAMHGHEVFCNEVQALNTSLLAVINSDGETPLLTAAASGRVSVASVLLRCCRDQKLSRMILKQDKRGCNALHYAIRNGHRDLALELIEEEPALSHAVNLYGESPMFIAVMRNYKDVSEKLLETPDSAHEGPSGFNALHAAVRNGNSDIATKIMEKLPALATEETIGNSNPLQLAVLWDKIDVLGVLLKHDQSLGYLISTDGSSPINSAAYRGHVGAARELIKHCPDVIYTTDAHGATCLHIAVHYQQTEFVDFVLGLPQSGRLINMRDSKGNTALHKAVQKCNPKMVAALLLHPNIDVTVRNSRSDPANWAPTDLAKTLNWNEVSMRLLKAGPQDATSIFNLHKEAKDKVTDLSRKDIKSLTQTYTSNTSLVAILIATITFAAAFTLPGGYSTDAGNEGLPIMARKIAFKAFLISDTLAMCSSLAVAFICVIAKWEDLEFLLYYRSFTKKLMWFAYMATTTAFSTGLYTVLAPRLPWLAIAICIMTSLLPILTKLLGEWPILRLKFRLGWTFKSELLNML